MLKTRRARCHERLLPLSPHPHLAWLGSGPERGDKVFTPQEAPAFLRQPAGYTHLPDPFLLFDIADPANNRFWSHARAKLM
ncbi:MAG: hypothetical protein ACRC1L_04025 [Prochlorococcaceae cyanobacterium]